MLNKFERLTNLAAMNCKCTSDQQTGKDPSLCIPCTASGMINSISSYITTAYTEINQMIDDDVTKLMVENGFTPMKGLMEHLSKKDDPLPLVYSMKGLPTKDNPLGDDDV